MLTVLALALAVLAPSAVLGLVLTAPRWLAELAEARRRRVRARGRLLVSPTRPLELLAADLRRLKPQCADQHRSRVQREAARLAYRDALGAAALAVGVAHDVPLGPDPLVQELDVLRLEQALRDAGLVFAVGQG